MTSVVQGSMQHKAPVSNSTLLEIECIHLVEVMFMSTSPLGHELNEAGPRH